jgi:hypothetical protein
MNSMIVIGTSVLLYPVTAARRKGAHVAVIDFEKEDPRLLALGEQDW